jgi:hypothetical protein
MKGTGVEVKFPVVCVGGSAGGLDAGHLRERAAEGDGTDRRAAMRRHAPRAGSHGFSS